MNHFKDEELVTIRGRVFPVIGGRLRIVHEDNQKVSIRTELLEYVLDEHAVARATVETQSGEFTGTGVATKGRDPKLVDALLELAETRAVFLDGCGLPGAHLGKSRSSFRRFLRAGELTVLDP